MTRAIVMLVLLVLLVSSCGNRNAKNASSPEPSGRAAEPPSAANPLARTSIGDLVKVEKRDAIATNDQDIAAKPDEVLYLLTFEGKSEITYEGKPQRDGPNRVVLVEAKGTEFPPTFAGTQTKEGALSDKQWTLNGSAKGVGGKFVFTGTMTLPEPSIGLVYLIPKTASALTLKDGDRRYPLN